MEDSMLRSYFKFDITDLEANRQGHLSEKQKRGLMQEYHSGLKVAVPLLVIVDILLVVGIILIILYGPVGSIPLFFIPFLLFFASGFLRTALLSRRMANSTDTVKKAQGPIRVVANHSGESSLHIDSKTFGISDRLTDHLHDGDNYTVYYMGDWFQVLSIENMLS